MLGVFSQVSSGALEDLVQGQGRKPHVHMTGQVVDEYLDLHTPEV